MRMLLFAGTSEGRILAERLSTLPVELTVSVATEYGREMLRRLPTSVEILNGRLDTDEMARLVGDGKFDLVVDATHPYAVQATDNIRAAAEKAHAPYLRLERGKGGDGDFILVASAAEAAAWLSGTEGNVLLATGSKELAVFTSVPGFAERLFPRILPVAEALAECERLGYARGHVIAMQGPFGKELNLALMRQFDIAVLVTKDGGAAGGFSEKISAAAEAGVRVAVIGRPSEEHGMGLDEVFAHIASLLEAKA